MWTSATATLPAVPCLSGHRPSWLIRQSKEAAETSVFWGTYAFMEKLLTAQSTGHTSVFGGVVRIVRREKETLQGGVQGAGERLPHFKRVVIFECVQAQREADRSVRPTHAQNLFLLHRLRLGMGGLRGENVRVPASTTYSFRTRGKAGLLSIREVGPEDDYAGSHGAGNEGVVRVPTLAKRSNGFAV